jgi:hypothetical protein
MLQDYDGQLKKYLAGTCRSQRRHRKGVPYCSTVRHCRCSSSPPFLAPLGKNTLSLLHPRPTSSSAMGAGCRKGLLRLLRCSSSSPLLIRALTLVGDAGSCTVGDGVHLGGQVGVAQHVTIGAGARVGAACGACPCGYRPAGSNPRYAPRHRAHAGLARRTG